MINSVIPARAATMPIFSAFMLILHCPRSTRTVDYFRLRHQETTPTATAPVPRSNSDPGSGTFGAPAYARPAETNSVIPAIAAMIAPRPAVMITLHLSTFATTYRRDGRRSTAHADRRSAAIQIL